MVLTERCISTVLTTNHCYYLYLTPGSCWPTHTHSHTQSHTHTPIHPVTHTHTPSHTLFLYNRNAWCNLWGAVLFAWGNVGVRGRTHTDLSWLFFHPPFPLLILIIIIFFDTNIVSALTSRKTCPKGFVQRCERRPSGCPPVGSWNEKSQRTLFFPDVEFTRGRDFIWKWPLCIFKTENNQRWIK